ncbi:Z-ring formation inhibitor MciZ [Thalassorhabdus alkalitolerans]|uniref:Z-ring formation inhibitor MciZ n=1 Tax=Thalassorhabdus alkalitolerans TaxID=2282697 RepID=A0ABW0YRU4_9BACI|nr:MULTISPECIES: Z-ring formation inhibitor MciZ [Bacillaceae]
MKVYITPRHIRIVGKAWEVTQYLKAASRTHKTMAEWGSKN